MVLRLVALFSFLSSAYSHIDPTLEQEVSKSQILEQHEHDPGSAEITPDKYSTGGCALRVTLQRRRLAF